jgi:glycosyltransferase involved in cell wall biosynthesis
LISNVILVSGQENTHTDRWLKSLRREFSHVSFFSTKTQSHSEISKYIVENFDSKKTIILSGPIDTVSLKLKLKDFPHFLLSFGYDLQLYYYKAESLINKILHSTSGGIVIDNKVNLRILQDSDFPNKKIHLIPWGVEKYWLQKRLHYKTESKKPVFISPRSHEKIYRIDIVINVFYNFYRVNPKSKLLLLGDGSKTQNIQKQISKMGLEHAVKIIGSVSEKKYKKYLEKSNFYLSASEVDGSSVSLLQAMALGVVPIVSDIPANNQWVKNGVTGYKFSLSNYDQQINKIANSILNTNQNDISVNCVELIVDKADWEKNFPKVAKFLIKNS